MTRRGRQAWAIGVAVALALSLASPARAALGEDGAAEFMGSRGEASAEGALPAGSAVQHDLAYGPENAQRLDVFQPAGANAAPIILMVHGGAWMVGSKTAAGVVANKAAHWLPKGFLLVSMNYRMSWSPRVLDQVDDVAAALAFVQANAKAWGGDPKRVILMGHSAGAHLVALMAAAPALAKAHGAAPWLATIALDSAAYDLPKIMSGHHYRFYDRVFGSDPSFWAQTSPFQQLTAAPQAPMLLVCSSVRSESCPQAQAFADKAQRLGGHVEVLPMALKHGEINTRLGADEAYTRSVDDFIHRLGLP